MPDPDLPDLDEPSSARWVALDHLERVRRDEAFVGKLDRHDAFALESAAGHVPGEVVSEAGCLMTLPHKHGMDGAFAARLRRSSS